MKQNHTIKQKGEKNLAIQNSEVYITVSIYDEIEQLVSEGKYYEVADKVKQIHDYVGAKHPYYPHYQYKPVTLGNTTVLEHDPITAEAHEKYPLSYRGKFKIAKEHNEEGKDIHQLIEDAYFKQEKINIDMDFFTTFLGNQIVETPNLNKAFKDGKWVISPEKLPDPLKLKLYFKGGQDISIIDYLEMSICGKEDNKFILFDNSEQVNAQLIVTLKIPLEWVNQMENNMSKNAKINVKVRSEFENEVEANLNLLRFMKQSTAGSGILAFKNLQENKDIITAPNFSFDGEMTELEEHLSFFERLYEIENHYGVKFKVPEKWDEKNWEAINILEHARENKPVVKNLKKLTADLNDIETINNLIKIFESKGNVRELMVEQSGPDAGLELFGAIFLIKEIQTIYNSLTITDLDRVKGKVKFMDEGETIKIILEPGNDPVYSEYYYFKC